MLPRFGLISVRNVRSGSSFVVFSIGVQFFQRHSLRRLSSLMPGSLRSGSNASPASPCAYLRGRAAVLEASSHCKGELTWDIQEF